MPVSPLNSERIMPQYKCNLLIPGAAKSGTSSLHQLLGMHPDVVMSRPKEPQFFSFDRLFNQGARAHNNIFCDTGETEDVVYWGESSQSYFVHDHAIERIQHELGPTKIILLLRDPFDRLLSHYTWRRKQGVESRPLRTAIQESGLSAGYEYDPESDIYRAEGGYLLFSKYSVYVPKWIDAFGEKNVLLLRTEDLKNHQSEMANACFQFLGLEDYDIDSHIYAHSTAQTTRLPHYLPAPLRAAAKAIPKRVRETSIAKRILAAVRKLSTPSSDADISPELEAELRDRLEPDFTLHNSVPRIASYS